MQINLEKLPKSRVKISLEVSHEEMKPFFAKALEKLSHEVKIKGFREGKAPKIMVLESVGINKYHSTVLDSAIPQFYFEAVQKEKLIPISQPAVSVNKISEEDGLNFTAEVDIKPEIILGDYKSVRVKSKSKSKSSEVGEDEIEKVVKRLLYQSAKFTEVSRPAAINDHIEIDFEGLEKNIKQENLSNKNYPLILGEGVLIPGFEKELEGLKKGDQKEFKLKVNSPTGEKEIDFQVIMNLVREVELPELNNEFSKKFGHDNPENLKKAIRESIKKEKIDHQRLLLEQEILEKVSEKAKLEIPESLIEQEVSRKLSEMQQQMGVIWPQYLQKINKTVEDLRKELRLGAEKQVKFGLVLGEIAKDMGFLKNSPKTQAEQQEVIRKTMDKLIEITTK